MRWFLVGAGIGMAINVALLAALELAMAWARHEPFHMVYKMASGVF